MALLGRMVIHPVRSLYWMAERCLQQLWAGTLEERLMWLCHLLGVTAVLWVVHTLLTLPAWA